MNQLIKRQQQLITQLKELRTKIEQLPDGKLIISQHRGNDKWYISNGLHPIYIPKKDIAAAQALARKKYYLLQEQELSYELKIINQFLSAYQKSKSCSSELLSLDSPYRKLLIPGIQFATDFSQWASADYKKNAAYPEQLIHKSISGHIVRSKSEENIANTLFFNNIPFRYEEEITLNGIVMHPDFTIRHPKTGETFYWEHFGLIDKRSYRENAYQKLQIYGNNNIYPTINLITTYETADHPIDSGQISEIIEKYFK